MVAAGETTAYIGDALALVVADTREQAQAAARAVAVEYEVLEPVTSVPAALATGAPKIGPKGNVLGISKAKKGDAEKAFAQCAYIHEAVYQTQWIEHAYMEPEAALALPEDGRLVVYTARGLRRPDPVGTSGRRPSRGRGPGAQQGGFGGARLRCKRQHLAASRLGKPRWN